MFSIISWGIPNTSHPFTYHMDEWHQLQSIKSVIKTGSPNVSGAAHGPVLHFVLSGVYLGFFYLIKIIDPFIVSSSVTELGMQERIFIVLRTSTLIFGVLSIILIYQILKQYLKVNPVIPTILFTVSPLWLSLSNYFKYDIAVTFWICLFIFFAFKYRQRTSIKNYSILSFIAGVSFAIKISVAPILVVLIFAFILFEKKWYHQFKKLFIGLVIFFCTFILLGIPDLPFHLNNYKEYLFSNIVTVPQSTNNYKFGMPYWVYALTNTLPTTFGIVAFILFVSSIVIFILKAIKIVKNGKLTDIEIFLFLSFTIFVISILPLRLYAWGNRALVFYPFIILITGIYIHKYLQTISRVRIMYVTIFILVVQLLQSLPLISYKYLPDVRTTSSMWMRENLLKGERIGLENIPIYQEIPDLALYEFYMKQHDDSFNSNYEYDVIDSKSKNIPKTVIVTNRKLHENYMIYSEKKELVRRLQNEGYKIKKEFLPPHILYWAFNNELGFFASGLIASPTITIYER